jgi:hypothetical protein
MNGDAQRRRNSSTPARRRIAVMLLQVLSVTVPLHVQQDRIDATRQL